MVAQKKRSTHRAHLATLVPGHCTAEHNLHVANIEHVSMSRSFSKDPVRIHCPCADSPADAPSSVTYSEPTSLSPDDNSNQARTIFDPTQPRAKYSLHALAYLYFCQECQAIRCPRCVQEEIVSAFCPMCLFEVPLTSIKADGNRLFGTNV